MKVDIEARSMEIRKRAIAILDEIMEMPMADLAECVAQNLVDTWKDGMKDGILNGYSKGLADGFTMGLHAVCQDAGLIPRWKEN